MPELPTPLVLPWDAWTEVFWAAGYLAAAAAMGWLVYFVLFRGLKRLARKRPDALFLDDSLLEHTRAPSHWLLPLLAVFAALPVARQRLPDTMGRLVTEVVYVLLIVAVAWLLVRLTRVLEDVVLRTFDVEQADNLRARKVVTQFQILRRILLAVVVILALAAILLRYETLRNLGTGLLASAGIAGIIVGFAAQKTLGNLLAGFQIALTQPIRLDDVVIVKGEFGWVEEITLTYVVVRVWDLRRIVLPIGWFLENPFENWTRTSARLLGAVFLHVDYTVPLDDLRAELERILEASEHWDGEVCRVHVTDAGERTVQIRALMSAVNAPTAWELRCEVREKLITWLQTEHPDALPRMRAEVLTRNDDPRPDMMPG